MNQKNGVCKLFLVLLLAGLATGTASAQDDGNSRATVFVFAAPGAVSGAGGSLATLHTGGGADVFFSRDGGAAVSLEGGYLAPFRSFADGVGVASVNGSYFFGRGDSDRKTIPFFTAGYSLFFRGDTANLINVGGGVDRWIGDGWGVRVEGRNHITTDRFFDVHFFEGRIAFIFR